MLVVEFLRCLDREQEFKPITHRFSIAMRADVIYVMHEGEIVESGSHHDLIAQNGLYARSWAAQMQAADHGEEPGDDGHLYEAETAPQLVPV